MSALNGAAKIDAFAGDDRGIHLLAVVERVSALAGREIQRVGLSATVGNPEGLLDWLTGHCTGSKTTVTETGGTALADVLLDEVLHGSQPIGTLDWLALSSQESGRRHPVILAGRSWDLLEIDWKKRRIVVAPSEERGKVRWQGVRRGLSFVIAQRIRQLVLAFGESNRWSARAKAEMTNQKEQFHQMASQPGRKNLSRRRREPSPVEHLCRKCAQRYCGQRAGGETEARVSLG